ncbi:MAG: enoyl-CoA hydratase/isomerase family protein [candidate division NC10 bacterium]|nr:enoyl-CoA hydratase/isomerase family protein [candidate division NC10 bacterium]
MTGSEKPGAARGDGRVEAVQPRPPEAYQFRDVLYEKRDWIARITINRPRSYNSYTTATLQEMTLAFQDASWDDGVAVVVLTGAGDKAFCTGGDVKEYAEFYTRRPRDYWKYMGIFAGAIDSVRNCGKPVIARLNGIVAGGGNEFNLACDLAVAADHITLRQVGTRVGSVAAGGATQWLPITIGDRRAREMLFTCDEVTARQALDWGLVNRVVPAADLDKAVDELAQKIIDKFPECTRYTKQQVNYWKDMAWYSTVGHARDWLSLHFMSTEPHEGMTAFVEKRAPRYRELRQRAAEGGFSELLWGPYTGNCHACGATGIPEGFDFCGKCGAKLA